MTNKPAPNNPPNKTAPGAKPAAPAQSAPPAYTPLAWSYPFPPASKEDTTDPMTYMKALATAEDGFYPLGASGYWHGGIHFGQKTGGDLKQSEGVCAIATGEVVAYRLDSRYPELTYQDPQQEKRYALYSTGFVLLRHTLTLPPVPKKPNPAPTPSNAAPASAAPNGASAPAGASGANSTPPAPAPAPSSPPPDETLTFFSLYMHTLDWATYKTALDQAKKADADSKVPPITPPPYWKADRSYRALKPNKQGIPKQKPTDLDDVEQCDVNTLLPGPVSGVRVYAMPGKGKIYGLLPEGTELTLNESDNGGHPGWAKIKELKAGSVTVGPMVGQPADGNLPWGYVFVSELEPIVEPGPLDTVVVLKEPHKIKAGEVVAHIGQYQRYREAKPTPPLPTRPLLHLEVFAGPDLPAFIKKSQDRVKQLQLPDTDKPFLEILAGAKLVTKIPDPNYTLEQTGLKLAPVSDPKSRWVKVQPKTLTMPAAQPTPPASPGKGKKSKSKPATKQAPTENPTGDPFWVDSSLVNQITKTPVKGWKDFPLKVDQADGPGTDFRDVFRVADLDKRGVQNFAREDKDASGKTKRWWNVIVGTRDGGIRQGWVRERDHPKVNLCSPWDWPGFELVDNSSVTPSEMFKRYLFVAGLAIGADQESFKTSADTLATSELIQKLEKAIDANHDGRVTAAELADAQKTPWLAEAISHMVVKSESEWGGNMAQWEAITPLMKIAQWKWLKEIERIKKLQWWEDIQCTDMKILPQEPKPWHLHPIGLIGNFLQRTCSCNKDITEEELDLILPPDVKEKGLFYDAHDKSVRGFNKAEFLGLLNKHMRENDMMTCVRKVHFLSQMSHECDELRTNEERRNRDGSIPSGWSNYHGGSNYHGRGLIQLTHDTNYIAYGKFVGDDAIGTDPDKVSHSIDHTAHSACWYWRKGSNWGDINPKADKNDFYAITVAVNGGFNHVDDRFVALNKLVKLLGAERCATNPGLMFKDYDMEKSSIYGSKFYKSHLDGVKKAVEAVNAKKSQV